MGARNKPAVFVSSTCYDLSQVRRDLKSFIEGYGFDALLSEFESFPVDPTATTVENCRRNIRERADVFVLLIGNRYGSTAADGQSVTNLEYVEARAKCIPVYVFVLQAVRNCYDTWKANPEGAFPVVDSTNLFGFIDSIYASKNVWVYTFEHAQGVIETLRSQWAYLFSDALQLWTRTQAGTLSVLSSALVGPALRLAIERPRAWEFHLFTRLLTEGIQRASNLKRDLQLGLSLGKGTARDPRQLLAWIGEQFQAMRRIVHSTGILMTEAYRDAVGPPGGSGDPARIAYVADRLASAYRSAIEWSLEFRRAHGSNQFDHLLEICSGFSSDYIAKIEQLADDLAKALHEIDTEPAGQAEERRISIQVEFQLPPGLLEKYGAEMARLQHVLRGLQ